MHESKDHDHENDVPKLNALERVVHIFREYSEIDPILMWIVKNFSWNVDTTCVVSCTIDDMYNLPLN